MITKSYKGTALLAAPLLQPPHHHLGAPDSTHTPMQTETVCWPLQPNLNLCK